MCIWDNILDLVFIYAMEKRLRQQNDLINSATFMETCLMKRETKIEN